MGATRSLPVADYFRWVLNGLKSLTRGSDVVAWMWKTSVADTGTVNCTAIGSNFVDDRLLPRSCAVSWLRGVRGQRGVETLRHPVCARLYGGASRVNINEPVIHEVYCWHPSYTAYKAEQLNTCPALLDVLESYKRNCFVEDPFSRISAILWPIVIRFHPATSHCCCVVLSDQGFYNFQDTYSSTYTTTYFNSIMWWKHRTAFCHMCIFVDLNFIHIICWAMLSPGVHSNQTGFINTYTSTHVNKFILIVSFEVFGLI